MSDPLANCDTPEQFTVIATVVRSTDDGCWVKVPTSTSCGGCQQQNSCSSGLVAKALPQRQQQLFVAIADVALVESLLAGQQIEISISPHAVITSALLVYLFPLCSFILTLLVANQLLWPEWLQLLAAVVVTFGTFHVVRTVELKRADQMQVRLVRLVPSIGLSHR